MADTGTVPLITLPDRFDPGSCHTVASSPMGAARTSGVVRKHCRLVDWPANCRDRLRKGPGQLVQRHRKVRTLTGRIECKDYATYILTTPSQINVNSLIQTYVTKVLASIFRSSKC